MMFLKSVFMAVIGLSFGFLVSAGVFTVLIAVGLVPRFAGKTHTSKKVFLYEEMVVAGTLFGNFISVFEYSCHIGEWVRNLQPFGAVTNSMWKWITVILCIFFGFFAGIFVGCLALAIAEMLNTIPVFARRIQFRHGLGLPPETDVPLTVTIPAQRLTVISSLSSWVPRTLPVFPELWS